MINFIMPVFDWYMHQMNYWTIMVCMTIESSVIPFPAELIVPPAAWKAASGELNIFLVILFSTIGSVLGALFNYFLAFILGRKLIYSFSESRLGQLCMINKKKIDKAESFFLKYGNLSTFIGRLTPGIRSFISLPAGLVKMPLKDFIFFTSLGAGIWNSILAIIGYTLGSQQHLLEKYILQLSIILAFIAISFLVYMLFNYYRKQQ